MQEYDYTDTRVMKQKYEGKVRDVKYNAALGLVAGLGTDGAVKLHDPCSDLRIVRSVGFYFYFLSFKPYTEEFCE